MSIDIDAGPHGLFGIEVHTVRYAGGLRVSARRSTANAGYMYVMVENDRDYSVADAFTTHLSGPELEAAKQWLLNLAQVLT